MPHGSEGLGGTNGGWSAGHQGRERPVDNGWDRSFPDDGFGDLTPGSMNGWSTQISFVPSPGMNGQPLPDWQASTAGNMYSAPHGATPETFYVEKVGTVFVGADGRPWSQQGDGAWVPVKRYGIHEGWLTATGNYIMGTDHDTRQSIGRAVLGGISRLGRGTRVGLAVTALSAVVPAAVLTPGMPLDEGALAATAAVLGKGVYAERKAAQKARTKLLAGTKPPRR